MLWIGILFGDILKNHIWQKHQHCRIYIGNGQYVLTKSSKPSNVPLNSARAQSIRDVDTVRRDIQRTLVALHDDPDSGADTLVDELER